MLGQQHRQWEIHTGWTGITGQLPELQYPWCWWDECHSWNAGMEGAGRGRFDTTALMVSADGGEPLDEDQGMENKGGAAVGSTPERAMCRLKKTTRHWAEYSLFCHLQQWPQQPEKLLFSSAFTQHKQDKGQGKIRTLREQKGTKWSCSLRQVGFSHFVLPQFYTTFGFVSHFMKLSSIWCMDIDGKWLWSGKLCIVSTWTRVCYNHRRLSCFEGKERVDHN